MSEEKRIVLPIPFTGDLKPSLLPTMKVKSRGGDVCIINRQDYNTEEYEPYEEDQDEPKRKVAPPTEPPKYTRKRLAQMSLEALKALPEFAEIEEPNDYKTKDQVIDAILSGDDKD